jgi:hypothetical protein
LQGSQARDQVREQERSHVSYVRIPIDRRPAGVYRQLPGLGWNDRLHAAGSGVIQAHVVSLEPGTDRRTGGETGHTDPKSCLEYV